MNLLKLAVASCVVSAVALAEGPPPPSQVLLDQGKQAFNANCVACHGATGEGDGPAGKVLNPHPRNYKTDTFKQGDSVPEIFKTINTGVPGTPMVGWAQLPEADRWALAYYVKELQHPGTVLKAAEPAKPTAPAKPEAKPVKPSKKK